VRKGTKMVRPGVGWNEAREKNVDRNTSKPTRKTTTVPAGGGSETKEALLTTTTKFAAFPPWGLGGEKKGKGVGKLFPIMVRVAKTQRRKTDSPWGGK